MFPLFGALQYFSDGLMGGTHVCSLAILLFFLSLLAVAKRKRTSIFTFGIVFIGTVFFTTMSLGLGSFSQAMISNKIFFYSRLAYLGIGAMAVFVGVLSFIDWVQYQRAEDESRFILKLSSYPGGTKNTGSQPKEDTAAGPSGFSVFLILVGALIAFSSTFLSSVYSVPTHFTAMLYTLSVQGMFLPVILGTLLYSGAFVLPLFIVFVFSLVSARSKSGTNRFFGNPSKLKIITSAVFFAVGAGLLFAFR